ncbi:hypothetical protein ACHAWC_005534 [Mediolabrus comicus]
MNTTTPSTQGSTPQKSPSSAAGMGDDDVTPQVLFTDKVVDIENAATHPLQSPSPPASVDIATPDAQQLPALKQNRPALNTCDSNRGYRVRRVFGLSESFAEGDGNEKSLIRMMYGSIFAYVLLGTWAWTICALITLIHLKGCDDAFENPSVSPSGDTFDECNEFFTGSVACAHSIIFGLLSAVVIHETGTSDETATHRLSSIAKPLLERRQKDANCLQRALFGMVVSLPTVYVVSWTVLGLFCFVFSLSMPDGASGPLFYTGQTWLGISIKAAYSFFGVSPDDSTTDANDGSPDEKRREQQEVDAEERLGPFQMINVECPCHFFTK